MNEEEVLAAREKLKERMGNTQIGGKGIDISSNFYQALREERRSMLISKMSTKTKNLSQPLRSLVSAIRAWN